MAHSASDISADRKGIGYDKVGDVSSLVEESHRGKPTDVKIALSGNGVITDGIGSVDEDDSSEMVTFNKKVSPFIIMLTFAASISGFMFGYDTGYIANALTYVKTDLGGEELSFSDKEIITSATSLGALICALVAGICADIFGRKKSIMFSTSLFIIGGVLQVVAHSLWQMVIGRLIMGFGVGFGSLLAPLFISEIAPKHIRGRLTVINSLWLTGGQMIAYVIGAALKNVDNAWRILVGLSLIPPVLQFVCFLFLPDTPRFYVMNGQHDRAAKVLQMSYIGAEKELIDRKIQELIELNQAIPGRNAFARYWNTVKELFTVPTYLRALALGCGLQAIQQFSGWNSLMYFSPTLFKSIGFEDANAVSIVVAATNFVFTLAAFFVIDTLGRRVILLIGLPGMTVAMTVCAIAFHFIQVEFDERGNATLGGQSGGFSGWGVGVVVTIILFAAFYALGIGTVPWQQSELFPQPVRGVGTSFATATNWAGSMVIAQTFLTMLRKITPTGTFALFAGICFVSILAVYFFYPELSGLELEEVQFVLKDGFNIKASKALAKKRKQQLKLMKQKTRDAGKV